MTNKPKRKIVDIEVNKGSFGFFISWENGEQIEIELAGKEIILEPENEIAHKTYKLLEEQSDVIWCTNQVLDDFRFYPIPKFSIFAVDSKDNCFGTIGGCFGLKDDIYPVGYVSRNGTYGKIANNLQEFFSLVTFYPYWWDVVMFEQMGVSYDITALEIGKKENNLQYFARQREIEETLKLSHNPKSIELLISNIKSPPELMVYDSKDEAQKTNTFIDTSPYLAELEKQKELLHRIRKSPPRTDKALKTATIVDSRELKQ